MSARPATRLVLAALAATGVFCSASTSSGTPVADESADRPDLDGSAGGVVRRAQSGDWDPVADDSAGTFAANGIRRLRDGDLLVLDSRDGGLLAVDVPSGVAAEVPVRGRRALTSGDGLVLDHRILYVVRGAPTTAWRACGCARPTAPGGTGCWTGTLHGSVR
ncbi:MAG: hypothetical protein H0V32_01885 [Nocardioidaceae bacterium]|nr:hypothetical protein [Nocardioidaceae bacterium]